MATTTLDQHYQKKARRGQGRQKLVTHAELDERARKEQEYPWQEDWREMMRVCIKTGERITDRRRERCVWLR